jgi:hypothetical protein
MAFGLSDPKPEAAGERPCHAQHDGAVVRRGGIPDTNAKSPAQAGLIARGFTRKLSPTVCALLHEEVTETIIETLDAGHRLTLIGTRMSDALKLIVDCFVSLKNRRALEEMREHRQRLRESLQEKTGGCFDLSSTIRAFDSDIEIVEAGLTKLR